MSMDRLLIYIAGSFRHKHAVRLLGRELERMGCELLDWTEKASPPPSLGPAERRRWMDTDLEEGSVFRFCRDACLNADMLVYFGASGQDAGVEVGLAAGNGVPVLGIRGPLEAPGLMLHGAVGHWVEDVEEALEFLRAAISGASQHPVARAALARRQKRGGNGAPLACPGFAAGADSW